MRPAKPAAEGGGKAPLQPRQPQPKGAAKRSYAAATKQASGKENSVPAAGSGKAAKGSTIRAEAPKAKGETARSGGKQHARRAASPPPSPTRA